jgi:hypothetical protein
MIVFVIIILMIIEGSMNLQPTLSYVELNTPAHFLTIWLSEVPNAPVSIFVPHILVKYIFFGAL